MTEPSSGDLHVGPGFRLRVEISRTPRQVIDGFKDIETPDISDQMNRMYTMDTAVRLMTNPGLRLLGPALTVRTYPGDNLMVHKCLDLINPGDVVVIDAGSFTYNAMIGETIVTKARHRGVSGFVVDGMVRDIDGIRQIGDIPVFARGVTPVGPLHRGPGEINFPIAAGGVVVNPGDVVVGDENGVAIIPQEIAAEVLARLNARSAADAEYLAEVRQGRFSTDWVDSILLRNGLDVADLAVDPSDSEPKSR